MIRIYNSIYFQFFFKKIFMHYSGFGIGFTIFTKIRTDAEMPLFAKSLHISS